MPMITFPQCVESRGTPRVQTFLNSRMISQQGIRNSVSVFGLTVFVLGQDLNLDPTVLEYRGTQPS